MSNKTGVTGEKVHFTGKYQNRYGKKIELKEGSNFPPCPEKGLPTTWEKTE